MLYLELFLTFAKVGLFTFGGGYAMISMIEHAVVEQKKVDHPRRDDEHHRHS